MPTTRNLIESVGRKRVDKHCRKSGMSQEAQKLIRPESTEFRMAAK